MPKTHGKRKSWVKEITEIERLDDELTKELLKLRNKRLAIIDAINTLQDPVLQVLVEYRYIDNMRWEEICTKMHYSWRHVHRLHMIAIRKINTLQDPVLQVLVEYRYIDNMRWEEICTKMHYSWRHVHRLHMIAIRKLKIENSMYYTHYS